VRWLSPGTATLLTKGHRVVDDLLSCASLQEQINDSLDIIIINHNRIC
jgi:hypothetical protein